MQTGQVLIATRRVHAASLLLGLAGAAVPTPVVRAEEAGGGDEGVVGAIKSIFDPNEKTKAGKVLPKAYLKATREVVRTLRESLQEDDGGDIAKFRRNADAAKEAIREFLGGWRGQQAVAAEVRHVRASSIDCFLYSIHLPAWFTSGVVRRVGEGHQIAGGVLLQGRTLRFASTGGEEQDPGRPQHGRSLPVDSAFCNTALQHPSMTPNTFCTEYAGYKSLLIQLQNDCILYRIRRQMRVYYISYIDEA
jgi:hypothetical protein